MNQARDPIQKILQLAQRDSMPTKRYSAKVAFLENTDASNSPEVPFVPRSYTEAMNGPFATQWSQAIDEEMAAHDENNTFDLVMLPDGETALPSKHVFALKYDENGNVVRFKDRWVALGNHQQEGKDFQETHAPTAKAATNRLLYAMAAINDLEIRSSDVVTAYLNADIDCVVYVKLPPGYLKIGDMRVARLNKALYGTKQAGRLWYQCLKDYLVSVGFRTMYADPSVFIRDSISAGPFIVSVSTDDCLMVSKSNVELDAFEREFESRFKMKRQGDVKHHLGIAITRNRDKRLIYLSQRVYIRNMLERYDMQDCKPIDTPMMKEGPSQLTIADCPTTMEETHEMDKLPYRAAIGSLLSLAICTRPDISVSVGIL